MESVIERLYKDYLDSQLDRIITPVEMDNAFEEPCFFRVYKDGQMNLMLENGKLLSDKFYDYISTGSKINCGLYLIHDNSLGYNYINQDGELLSDSWFLSAEEFKLCDKPLRYCAKVEYKPGKFMKINTQGKKEGLIKINNKNKYKSHRFPEFISDQSNNTIKYGTKVFKTKYKPLFVFGNGRFIFCFDAPFVERHVEKGTDINKDYIYDSLNDEYIPVSSFYKDGDTIRQIYTNYYSNVLHIENRDFLFYDNKIIDLKTYFKKHKFESPSRFRLMSRAEYEEAIENGIYPAKLKIKEGTLLQNIEEFEMLHSNEIQEAIKNEEAVSRRVEQITIDSNISNIKEKTNTLESLKIALNELAILKANEGDVPVEPPYIPESTVEETPVIPAFAEEQTETGPKL